MQLAVGELRRAARTSNALEKLQALEVAEQKLKDAAWLSDGETDESFSTGLAGVQRSRNRALRQEAIPALERLLEAAERKLADQSAMLQPAGQLLSLLHHYLPDDEQTQALAARFRDLGGDQPPYQPITPLSEMYHRPAGGAGCGAVIGLLLVALLLIWFGAA